jgi:chitinase
MKPIFTLGRGLLRSAMVVALLLSALVHGNTSAQVSPPVAATTAQHNKQVIGYITQWDAWKNVAGIVPAGGYNQLNVDYSQYTILNFSFFGVAVDGSLHSGDYRNKNIYQVGAVQQPSPLIYEDIYSSWDMYLLYGELDILYNIVDNSYAYTLGYRNSGGGWSNVNTGKSGSFPLSVPKQGGAPGVLALAHQKGVKVMASIGGWSMCKHYPEMAADATKRAKFIAGCKELISLGFDGIDFDWEYPNGAGMNIEHFGPADYANFASLAEEVRTAIGPTKLITSCFSAVPSKLAGFDWPRLNNTINYFNMMTYDYNGGWSNKAGHNSPLYEYPGQEFAGFSLDATTKGIRALGVNMSKVNLGAAFYGRGVITSAPATLNGATVKRAETVQPDGPIQTSADYTNWTKDVWDGTPNYSYILQQTGSGSGWTEYWDDAAKVPYKTKGNFFLSYDNERSVAAKAQYIKDNSLAGVIIWQVYGDMLNMTSSTVPKGKLIYCPNTTSPLVNKINETFASGTTPGNVPPKVNITSPANNASYGAPASISIAAAASDTDGTISKVSFYHDNVLISADSVSPYAATWSGVAAGSYALTAVAQDNKGATTTSATVNVTVTSGPVTVDSGKVLVGYWQNWGSPTDASPYIPLRNVNPKYNVIQIAFAETNADKATLKFVPENTTPAQFASDVQYLQSQGKKVLLSIGGENGNLDLTTAAQKQAFVTSLKALLDQYNFDGFDLDVEGGANLQLNNGDNDFTAPTTPKVVNLIAAVKEVIAYRKGQGKNAWLTMAPETYYVQTAYGSTYSPLVGAYLPVIYGLRNELTVIHTQYYNTGSVLGLDNGIYNQATSDFIVAMTDMLLQGFPVSGTGKTFPALREDQVAFGLPASSRAAGGGYTTPANVVKALDYLTKGIGYGGAYTLRKPGGYKGLRGIMTWSINWDKVNNDEFANTYYPYFFGSSPVNQPPVVALTAPANNATFTAPASITITANASDPDGSVARVQFYNGTSLLATDSVAPYSYTWTNVAAGTYSITAKATDNSNASTTSAAVSVTVNGTSGNKPPVVNITSPLNNASFTAPATVNIQATATDSDGTIKSVSFYNGSTLLGVDSVAPYAFSWANVAAGSYSITAKAVDNGNASTTSAAVAITVTGGGGSCNGIALWSATKVYVGNDQAVYNGKIYKAKWWTSGDQPDINTGDGKPWQFVSNCPAAAAASFASVAPASADNSLFTLEAYPNPVSGNDLQLKVNGTPGEKLLIEVLGLSGRAPVVQQIFIPSSKGEQPVRLDISKVPSGTWIIKVTSQSTGKVGSTKVFRLKASKPESSLDNAAIRYFVCSP